jgi:hypothetical protein
MAPVRRNGECVARPRSGSYAPAMTSVRRAVRTVLEAGGVLHLEREIPTLAAFVEECWRVHAVPNLAPNRREVLKARLGPARPAAPKGPQRTR